MSVSPSNGGSVEVDGANPETYYSSTFNVGARVDLKALPAAGYRFDRWEGGLYGSKNPASIIMDDDEWVIAYFTRTGYDLTVDVLPVDGGVVKVNGSLPAAYPVTYTYPPASSVSLEAVPAPGYYFDRWSGNLTGAHNPVTETMDASKSVTANFLPLVYEDISADEALTLIQRGGFLLIDVREDAEFCSGHVPGALNYPWISGILETTYDNDFAVTTPLIVLCRTGVRSRAAADFLHEAGYRQVYNVLGGIVSWEGEKETCGDGRLLYFTHVETRGSWETDLFVLNDAGEDLNGSIVGYDDRGEFVCQMELTVPPLGRRKIRVGDPVEGLDNPDDIRYAILYSSVENVKGFQKFYIPGKYSAAVSAVSDIQFNGETIYLPRIASDKDWVTGLAFVNTSAARREISFRFDDGSEKMLLLEPLEHKALRLRDLFAGIAQPDIAGATLENTEGVIGLSLFLKETDSLLSGFLLSDDLSATLHYPHIPDTQGWVTGIGAYNAASVPVTIEVHPYDGSGEALPVITRTISNKGVFLETPLSLGLPENTAWLSVVAGSPDLAGFEVFTRGKAMAGFENVHAEGRSGVFPNIDPSLVTGIVLVNLEEEFASVNFTARDDDGNVIAVKTVGIDSRSQLVGSPDLLLDGDLSGATTLHFSADKSLAGFQINVSRDGKMIDALQGF